MNLFGVGIDIVDFDRIKIIYLKYGEKFAKKILNVNELNSFFLSKHKVPFLAKRFAAKEAIGKAMGVGIVNGFLLKNIILEHDNFGKPIARLIKKKELELYLDKIIHISISDDKNFAVANAIILNK